MYTSMMSMASLHLEVDFNKIIIFIVLLRIKDTGSGPDFFRAGTSNFQSSSAL